MPPEIANLEIRSFTRREERDPGEAARVTHIKGQAALPPDLPVEDRDAALAQLADACQADAGPGTWRVNIEAPWTLAWFEYRADAQA